MKVWVVIGHFYGEASEVYGVFDSYDKARAYAVEQQDSNEGPWLDSWHIEDWEVK